jgi:RNA polymerase sigma factor (sigma-70 family)
MLGQLDSNKRERLFAEFAPLVRRLVRQYAADDAELRQDLPGEIYVRFSAFLSDYDPAYGVPLRPYLVRSVTASVYTFVRRRWRALPREVSLDSVMADGYAGISSHSAHRARPSLQSVGPSSLSSSLLSTWCDDPTPRWDDAINTRNIMRRLPGLIARLPKRQRLVVLLHYYDHRSFDEIASILEVRPATARSLLRHGLTKLRLALAPGTAETWTTA